MALLSVEQAASYLHLNVKRVQALARAGRLPGRRLGRRWLFDQRDLDLALGRSPDLDRGGLDLSARNQLRGRVLGLTVGDPIVAVIKSTEVMIAKDATS